MPISEAKKRNNAKYNAKCKPICMKPLAAEADQIKMAAKASGQTLQGWLLQAARERMQRDGFTAAPPTAEKDPADPG